MIDLTKHLDRLVERVEQQEFTAAADAMATALREGAAAAMGGDLSFSGGAGTAVVTGEAQRGRVVVGTAGAYALADKGRQTSPATITPAGRALRTPYGPRRTVKGSTWAGFGITARYGRQAIEAGVRGVVGEVNWGRS